MSSSVAEQRRRPPPIGRGPPTWATDRSATHRDGGRMSESSSVAGADSAEGAEHAPRRLTRDRVVRMAAAGGSAAVIAVSFLLLMLVFRSILVPLKAAVMNLLSIGAAYGVLVVVFQWGWGAKLLGLDGPTTITSVIVIIMFPILFGLSMDYEVFLLSRIREEYDRTGDNTESVARGLAGTGRVVTSAALIMVAVFASFVFSPIPSLKMLGLGLAVAILIDATIVRMVLVPATMELLGDANWWLPAWLGRRLPRLHVEGESAETIDAELAELLHHEQARTGD